MCVHIIGNRTYSRPLALFAWAIARLVLAAERSPMCPLALSVGRRSPLSQLNASPMSP